MTITPILMAALMFSIVLLLEGFQWLAKATWWWVPQVRKTTIFLFLYGTFLILPGESTIIFRCFNCTNVSSDSDTDTYLLADLSMSCQSDRYLFAWRWAIAMVVIYPIGVPLMYFCLLYQNRRAIQNRCDIEVSENEQNEAHWIRFLYSTYRNIYLPA